MNYLMMCIDLLFNGVIDVLIDEVLYKDVMFEDV